MKWSTILPVTLAGLMGAGCGEGLDPEQQPLEQASPALSAREEKAPQEAAPQEAAPQAPAARGREGEARGSVWLKGCWYRVSMKTEYPPFPPHELLRVERQPSRHCEAASTLLEMGYDGWRPLVATRGGELAVAWTRRGSPSGSAISNVLVFHVSPETLAVKRTAFLSVYPGHLDASAMRFEGHRLVLDTSVGPVTLPRFFTSEEPPQGLPPPPWL